MPTLIRGGSGRDTLYADYEGSDLWGRDGDDYLVGGRGNDRFFGGRGSDTFIGGHGGFDLVDYNEGGLHGVTVHLGEGFAEDQWGDVDIIIDIQNVRGSRHNDIIHGSEENNTLFGNRGDDVIRGHGGQDNLFGDEGNDYLSGGDDNDTLVGGTGDDTLHGGEGDNFIDGGFGIDTVDYRNANVRLAADGFCVVVDLSREKASQNGFGGVDFIHNVENVIGSDHGDFVTGNAGNNLIRTRGGNDVIVATLGNDTLDGGGGRDLVDYSRFGAEDGVNGVHISIRVDGVGTLVGEAWKGRNGESYGHRGLDRLTGIEDAFGSRGDDIFHGHHGNNTFYGRAGDDTFIWSGGHDRFEGEGGVNRFLGHTADAALTIDLQTMIDGFGDRHGNAYETNSPYSGNRVDFTSVRDAEGSRFSDMIRGSDLDNVLDGGAGDDILEGRGGNDTIVGGSGRDAASYASAAAGVSVSLQTGVGRSLEANDAARVGRDTLSEIENVIGSAHADVLRGDGDRNELFGGGGNDTLLGAGGDDYLSGGAGADLLVGGAGWDTLNGGAGADEFVFAGAFGQDHVLDFRRGTDKLVLDGVRRADGTLIESFADLDTNGDGRFDSRDGGMVMTTRFVDLAFANDSGIRLDGIAFLTEADFIFG